jgi:FkbM family methyltransferase
VNIDSKTGHPVFQRFPDARDPRPGFSSDFTGARFREELDYGIVHGYPPIDNEYFEWIDILESVAEARGPFVMAEIGAGFGRWSARAVCAARNIGIPARVVAVEPEPLHFEWLQRTFRDNGIEGTAINAAVGAERGKAQFYVEGYGQDASSWYGQCLAWDAGSSEGGSYCGRPVSVHPSGYRSVTVETMTLSDVLAPFARVDLVDMDIQGAETTVIRSSWEILNRKVKRLHIGTHSAEVEDSIRRLLTVEGWECKADYGCCAEHHTSWGNVQFVDGVQSWLNPHLGRPGK